MGNEPVLTIDARRGFGRPCVAGTGLRADTVAQSVWAEKGDVALVMDDYGVSRVEALWCCCWWVYEGALSSSRGPRRTRWTRWADHAYRVLAGFEKNVDLCDPDDYEVDD